MLKKFFLWCSGTNGSILKHCRQSEETETNRQATIGAIILLTALFAFGSSSYALYTLFGYEENILGVKVIFIGGFLWAFMIFIIDRFLVSTLTVTQKATSKDTQNGAINYKFNLINIFIRLVLAVVIGITIATPLELRIFSTEIENHILEEERTEHDYKLKQEDKNKEERIAIGNSSPEPTKNCDEYNTNTLDAEIKDLKEKRTNNLTPIYKKHKLLRKECINPACRNSDNQLNTSISQKHVLIAKRSKCVSDNFDIGTKNTERVEKSRTDADIIRTSHLRNIDAQYPCLKGQSTNQDITKNQANNSEKSAPCFRSLMTRIRALNALTTFEYPSSLSFITAAQSRSDPTTNSEQKPSALKNIAKESGLFWPYLTILFLFMLVEAAAILSKWGSGVSAYDIIAHKLKLADITESENRMEESSKYVENHSQKMAQWLQQERIKREADFSIQKAAIEAECAAHLKNSEELHQAIQEKFKAVIDLFKSKTDLSQQVDELEKKFREYYSQKLGEHHARVSSYKVSEPTESLEKESQEEKDPTSFIQIFKEFQKKLIEYITDFIFSEKTLFGYAGLGGFFKEHIYIYFGILAFLWALRIIFKKIKKP